MTDETKWRIFQCVTITLALLTFAWVLWDSCHPNGCP
jgi:hypothetical protein